MTTYTKTITSEGFVTKLGIQNELRTYVLDESTNEWKLLISDEFVKIVKGENQMMEFEISCNNIESTEKLYVKETAYVVFTSGSSLVGKGRIQKIEYSTDYECKASGYGVDILLAESQFSSSTRKVGDDTKRCEWIDVSSQTIAKELLSSDSSGSAPYIIDPATTGIFSGVPGDHPIASLRVEYGNRLNALAKLAEIINYKWWLTFDTVSFDWDKAYFNMNSYISTSTTYTFNIGGDSQNCISTSKEIDKQNLVNDITCYDDKTKVMTKDGFKLFKDITFNDEIATLNPETEELEYHKPTAKQEYDYEGEMHHYKNQNVDLLVTPDHSLYCKKIWGSNFKRQESKKVFGKWLNFKKDCKWVGKEEEYFILPKIEHTWRCGRGRGHDHTEVYSEKVIPIKLWLEFMGWFLSEGNLHKNTKVGYKIRITQNYPNLNRIIGLIEQMGYRPFVCKNPDRIEFYDKQLYLYLKQFGKAKDKYIPEFIKNLHNKQINLFLNILFEGDGSHNEIGEITHYYSISKKLIEDVSELLLKTGRGFKFGYRDECFSLSVNNHHLKCRVNKKNQTKEDYSGRVYDLTIPNHIMFIRRNNICIWSGNCLGYGDGLNQISASAEDPTSIGLYGRKGYTITDKSIRKQDAAQDIADKYLADHKDPIVRITINPCDPSSVLQSVNVGDTVVVNDDEAGSTGSHIVNTITCTSEYGSLNLELQVSNKRLGLMEYMEKQEKESENISKYMQGATNIYWFGKEDACDNSNPMKLNVYIPTDAIAINKVVLRFSRPKFEAYSGNVSPTTSSGSYIANIGSQDVEITGAVAIDLTDNVNSIPALSQFIGCSSQMSITNLSGATRNYTLTIEQPVGTVKKTQAFSGVIDGDTRILTFTDGVDRRGGTWRFKWENGYTGDILTAMVLYNLALFGIYTPTSEDNVDINVAVGAYSTNVTNVAVNYEHSSDIDITDYVSTGWNTITITPSGISGGGSTCRLNFNGYVKCFIESRID